MELDVETPPASECGGTAAPSPSRPQSDNTFIAAEVAFEDKSQVEAQLSASAAAGSASAAKLKVEILLKPAGDAPILKKKNWSVDRSKKLSYVVDFTSRMLKLTPDENLFLYVSQCFAPALDAELGPLYDCFGSDGKLVLHYCRTQAWG